MPSRSRKAAPARPDAETPAAATDGADVAPPVDGAETDASGSLRVLKKYPNRRLYDTRSSSYITLADVKQMVLGGEAFEVRDAKSGEDLTRSILLQIILEEESAGIPMFTAQTLSQIIRLYGHAMQGVMGSVLEKNMAVFTDFQAQFLRPAMTPGMTPAGQAGAAAADAVPVMNPELWRQLMTGQAPALQTLLDGYVQQGRSVFESLQQAGSIFPVLPGMPGFPGPKQ